MLYIIAAFTAIAVRFVMITGGVYAAISEGGFKFQTPSLIKEKTTWLIWRRGLVSRYRALSNAENFALTRAINGDDFSVLCV